MNDASLRSALGVLASCLVHAAIALTAHGRQPTGEPTLAPPLLLELQVEQPAAPALSIERATPDVPAPQPERAEKPRRARVAPPSPAPAASEPGEAVAEPQKQEAAPEPGAPVLDLSPLAAARSLGDSTYFPLRDAGVARPDDPQPSPAQQARALAQGVPGLRASKGADRSAEGVVVDLVEDTLYNVMRPWKLLQKTMRGSAYRYTGGGFDAAILPDGRVRFREKDGPVITLSASQAREFGAGSDLGPAPSAGLSLGDPRALWHRLRGKDPHKAERRLFLERTRALREYLAGRASERGTPPDESVDADPVDPQLEPPSE